MKEIKTEVFDIEFVGVGSHGVHQMCTACLCATRTTHSLGDVTLKQYYMNILTETQLEEGESVLQSPSLCWECVAHLKRSVRFREQVQDSYRLLQPILLSSDKENLAEFLQTSAHRLGRLGNCCAYSIDISPQEDDTQVMTADDDVDDKAAAKKYFKLNIETLPSTTRAEHLDEQLEDIDACKSGQGNINTPTNIAEKQQCNVCDKLFTTKASLLRHKKMHTAVNPIERKICSKQSKNVRALSRHKRKHECETLFQCEVCQKSFSRKYSLILHMRIHTSEKPFKCDVCRKSFSQRAHLISHMGSHTGEKPFQCEVCEKSFFDSCRLIRHKRTHTGEKPFQCNVCQKSFSQRAHLTAHIRSHTGEKPFQCEVCSNSFSDSSRLMRHKKIHTGEKPFQCQVCFKSFCDSSHLLKHKRTHTGEKPFQCEVCSKSFSDSSSLLRHKRIHTGENPRH